MSLPARSVRWSASKTSFYTINICGTTRTRTKKNARPARVLFFEYLSGGGTLALASPPAGSNDSYLVDPASSHMLVSKIKPCMSKYKQLYTVKLQMAHYISYSLFDGAFTTWITVVILELIHA